MEIRSAFALPLPPDQAYALLLDLDRIAPCLPGAELGPANDDGAREVTMTVRLGPMKFAYAGTLAIGEHDPATRRAVLTGRAREKRGQGNAAATIAMEVEPADGGGSQVRSTAQVELTGRAAQTGRGIVEDVSRQMIDQMAACLAAQHAPAPAVGRQSASADGTATGAAAAAPTAPPTAPRGQEIRAGKLLARILWERIRRLLGRR